MRRHISGQLQASRGEWRHLVRMTFFGETLKNVLIWGAIHILIGVRSDAIAFWDFLNFLFTLFFSKINFFEKYFIQNCAPCMQRIVKKCINGVLVVYKGSTVLLFLYLFYKCYQNLKLRHLAKNDRNPAETSPIALFQRNKSIPHTPDITTKISRDFLGLKRETFVKKKATFLVPDDLEFSLM